VLGISFKTTTHESAQQIGIIIIQGIQKELSGPRHGRWYPTPNNALYDRMTYKSLSPDERAKINYHAKFVGARTRDGIMGSAYQASAPGEAPASRTGRLRQSFYMIIEMLDTHIYEVSVRTTVFYADDLEYGTEKVDPRPFIERAVTKKLKEIIALQHQFIYYVVRGKYE
jgi:hypothetical protein